jgi:hypothetical protein
MKRSHARNIVEISQQKQGCNAKLRCKAEKPMSSFARIG